MKKTAWITMLALCAALMLTACGMSKVASEGAHSKDAASSEEDLSYESAAGKQIRVTAGEVEVIVTLNDSHAASDLVEMLPLELTLIERNSFAKGMTLPAHLSAEEETTREYSIGDFGYWDAGPDLAIFYDDIYEQTVVPVIPLGKAEAGAELLANTSGTVTLELMETGSE